MCLMLLTGMIDFCEAAELLLLVWNLYVLSNTKTQLVSLQASFNSLKLHLSSSVESLHVLSMRSAAVATGGMARILLCFLVLH